MTKTLSNVLPGWEGKGDPAQQRSAGVVKVDGNVKHNSLSVNFDFGTFLKDST